MTRPFLELVGLLATESHTMRTYHIDYMYKLCIDGRLTGSVTQKGFDFPLHVRFEEIVDALSLAYGPALKKRWTHAEPKVYRVYLQLNESADPKQVLLSGRWVLDCEL